MNVERVNPVASVMASAEKAIVECLPPKASPEHKRER